MSQPQTTPSPMMAEIAREWLAARVVFVAGFLVAILFVAYWTYGHHNAADDLVGLGAPVADENGMQGQVGSGRTNQAGIMLCGLAIATGQNFGVMPANMRYAGGPEKTAIAGRYICATDDPHGVRFLVAVDLICKDLRNPGCVNLFSITKQADSSSVFQRHQFPGDPGVTADNSAPPPAAPAPDANVAPPPDPSATPDSTPPDASSDTPH